MADEIQRTPSPAASATESAPAPAPGKKATSIGARIDRAMAAMKEKNAALAAENAKLKALLSVARSATTRISRIPKAKKVAADPEPAEA